MTTNELELGSIIVKDNFGLTCESIVRLLSKKRSYPIGLIASDLKIDLKYTAKLVTILIKHGILDYKLNNQKNIIEYSFNVKNTLNRLKYPKYIYASKLLYGYEAELIIEELLLHSYLEMSNVLIKVKSRLNTLSLNIDYNKLIDIFTKLANNNYIKRVFEIDRTNNNNDTNSNTNGSMIISNGNNNNMSINIKDQVPTFIDNKSSMFVVPKLTLNELYNREITNEDNESPACKIRKQTENYGDNGIYWCVNTKKFNNYLRDQAIIHAFENKIDKNAANIIKSIMVLTSTNDEDDNNSNNNSIAQTQSRPITTMEIQRYIRSEYPNLDPSLLDKYLSVISQDSFECVIKAGDYGGGAWFIDYKKGLTNLCRAHIESFINERYGSKSLRIFKIIYDKVQLEQKQIEEFALLSLKECKSLLYNMLNDNILTLNELSKTNDHIAKHTYFLFTINLYQIVKKLLDNSYKAMFNLKSRYQYEINENKRLIEKQQKIDTIVDTLKSQSAEQSEIDEVQSMISEAERKQIKRINDLTNKIELSQLQLEETIFLFEYFFNFNIPYVKPTKR